MRLTVSHNAGAVHTELASAVSWEGGSLLSGSDDQTVQRWSADGQHANQVRYMPPFLLPCSICIDLTQIYSNSFRFAAWVLTAQTFTLVQQEHRAAAWRPWQ